MKLLDWLIDYIFTIISAFLGQISISKYYENIDTIENITARMITDYTQMSDNPEVNNIIGKHLDIVCPRGNKNKVSSEISRF